MEVRAEIDRCKGQGANADSARKRILSELEERLHKTEAKAEVYEQARALSRAPYGFQAPSFGTVVCLIAGSMG